MGPVPHGTHPIMVANIEVVQVNLHHTSLASVVIACRFISDNLDNLSIQELWIYREPQDGCKQDNLRSLVNTGPGCDIGQG